MKHYRPLSNFFCFIFLSYIALSVAVARQRQFLIDLGSPYSTTSAANSNVWNNLTSARTGDGVANLKDSTGSNSTVNLSVLDSFWQQTLTCNNSGTTTSTLYPASATSDSFFIGNHEGYLDNNAKLRISGLSSNAVYSLKLYASRMTSDLASDRTTIYTVNGQSKELQIRNNVNGYAGFSNLVPITGNLDINVALKTGAIYGYLGVIDLSENLKPTANAGADLSISIPIGSTTATIALKGSGSDKDGSISKYFWSQVSGASVTISNANSTSATANLPAGSYVFRLTVTDNGGASAYDDVAVKVSGTTTTTTMGTVRVLVTTAPGEIYRPTGYGIENWQPGDIINIPAGNYSLIDIGNFHGDATHPIIIRNSGGQVVVRQFRLSHQASYFKLLGNGDPNYQYGIKIVGTRDANGNLPNAGLSAFANDFEVANIEVDGAEAGFYFKKNPDATDAATIYPNYVMKNIYIHHNYIHHTQEEGMYIGHTYPNADPYSGNLVPIRLSNVEIAYNIVEHTGWDGIQLSNAREGGNIHHNKVSNFGEQNHDSQQAGIILGGNTTGQIHDNTVENGTGNGLQAFGYGPIKVYNNHVENVGKDGTSTGQQSIFCNDPVTQVESNPKQQMIITSNQILYPQLRGGVSIYADHANTAPCTITNNQFIIPNAPSNWQTKYMSCPVSGTTITGNTLVAP